MYDFLLTPEERKLKKEVRRFVFEEVTPDFLRKMDNNEIVYPREFVAKLAERGLRGIRFPPKYGGRGMSWVAEVAATEEIGCLGMALGCCLIPVSFYPYRSFNPKYDCSCVKPFSFDPYSPLKICDAAFVAPADCLLE